MSKKPEKKNNNPEIIANTLAKIFRANYSSIIEQSGEGTHFNAGSDHPNRPVETLYKAPTKDKFKEIGHLGTDCKKVFYELLKNGAAELESAKNGKVPDIDDGEKWLYIISQFNIDLPDKLKLAEQYRKINFDELRECVKISLKDATKAELIEDFCGIFTKFIETLAFNIYLISVFETRPTSVDLYKIKTALSIMTRDATIALDGEYLPTFTALFEPESETATKEKNNVAKAEEAAAAANKAAASSSVVGAISADAK
jgi:hypothetical protein